MEEDLKSFFFPLPCHSTSRMDYFFKLKQAGQATLVREYKQNLLRRKLVQLDIWFNNECIRRNLRPRYISLRSNINSTSSKKALQAATRIWIKEEVKKQFFKLNLINLKLKFLFFELTNILHASQWDSLCSSLLTYVQDLKDSKFQRLTQKLHNLSNYQNSTHSYSSLKNESNSHINQYNTLNSTLKDNNTSSFNVSFDNTIFNSELNEDPNISTNANEFTFHQRTLNLSNTNFNQSEITLLNKGIKYNFHVPPDTNTLESLTVECENIISKSNETYKKDTLRSRCVTCLNDFYKNNPRAAPSDELRTLKSIKAKIHENNLVLSKADKGNCLVILERSDYIDKVGSFLSTDEFTQIQSNPTDKFVQIFKNTLKQVNETLIFFNTNKFKLTPINPSTPLLYGLPKIHKPDIPIRPVVSYCGSPCHKLGSWLNQTLLTLTNFKSSFSVKNSSELANDLKEIHIPDTAFLVSFDVTNLFPSIPPNDCIQLVRELLINKTNLEQLHISNLCTLVNLVLKQNFFQFNYKFFSQSSGLAMGSALSPLLADIFMSHLETKIQDNPLFSHILFIRRYVDDIFAVFDGDRLNLTNFINFLNSLHPSIKFTHEIEINNSLPFLDLSLTRSNNKIKFSIYHKPTSTDSTIPFYSNHPYSHKFAAFHSYFSRLFSVPLDDRDFKIELDIIRQIGIKNGFPLKLINKIYYKHLNKFLNKNLLSNSKSENKYYSLPYWGPISLKLKNIFSSFNYNISFKTQHSLKSFTFNSKDSIPVNDKSGVYSINCSTQGCTATYVGQTGRKFSIRIKEHCKEIEKARNQNLSPSKIKSNFARHIHINNHTFDPESNTKYLQICNKSNKLDLFEILHINKTINNHNIECLNDQIQHSSTHLFNALDFEN